MMAGPGFALGGAGKAPERSRGARRLRPSPSMVLTARRPHAICGEHGRAIDIRRGAELHETAVREHADPVGDTHRLDSDRE